MLWWLFWASLLRHHAAPVGMEPVDGMVARPDRRYRPMRSRTAALVRSRQLKPLLRLICVDGVRVDRAAL